MAFAIQHTDEIAVKRLKLLYLVPLTLVAWPIMAMLESYRTYGPPLAGLRDVWCSPPEYRRCCDCKKHFKVMGPAQKMCVDCQTDWETT